MYPQQVPKSARGCFLGYDSAETCFCVCVSTCVRVSNGLVLSLFLVLAWFWLCVCVFLKFMAATALGPRPTSPPPRPSSPTLFDTKKPPLNLCFLNLGTLSQLRDMEAITRGNPVRKPSKLDFLLSSADVVDEDEGVSDEEDESDEEVDESKCKTEKPPRTDTEAILLTHNVLESLADFIVIFQPRILHLSQLKWLDLSFNLLSSLDSTTLAAVPHLIILNLHANRFVSLRSVLVVLAPLTRLRSLTLQANPLSGVAHLRLLVARALPWVKRLDHVSITRSEREPELCAEKLYVDRVFDRA